MDLVFGEFVTQNLHNLTEIELGELHELCSTDDYMLQQIMIGKAESDSPLAKKIKLWASKK